MDDTGLADLSHRELVGIESHQTKDLWRNAKDERAEPFMSDSRNEEVDAVSPCSRDTETFLSIEAVPLIMLQPFTNLAA